MNTNKTILLAVTGMSPAVVTETLYGIDRKGQEWPSEVKIITTIAGKKEAQKGLLMGQQIKKLCEELRKPLIDIQEEDIFVVTNAEGVEVDDARSVGDHEALANYIMRKVHFYTQDKNIKVHASIAGGRKTMTFYLGYAMSMFGRHFDKLSHVLVSEGFENPKLNFYFPTRESQLVEVEGRKYDFKDAEVTLADIPFIRQRSLMPKLIDEVKEGEEVEIDFRSLVDLINLGDDKESIKLEFHTREHELHIYDLKQPEAPLAVVMFQNVLWWAFYLLLAEEAFVDSEEQGAYVRPAVDVVDEVAALCIFLKVSEVFGLDTKETQLGKLGDEIVEALEGWEISHLSRGVDSLKQGLSRNRFSDYIRNITETLAQKLPKNLLEAITPKQIYKSADDIRPGKGGGGYGIDLPQPKKQVVIK